MFSYYGAKTRIAHLYPKPRFETIIEPFAGSARYALRHWKKRVVLMDLDPKICGIWEFLIESELDEILKGLPEKVIKGEKVEENHFKSQGQFHLMQFLISSGQSYGARTVSEWGAKNYPSQIRRIQKNHHKIRHWEIRQGEYNEVPNQEATWFIDAPYQFEGHKYRKGRSIDFGELSRWCRSRKGQVIVCESSKANWLPFRPFKTQINSGNTSTKEVLFTNDPIIKQISIFQS